MDWLLLVFYVYTSGISSFENALAVRATEEQCIASLEAMEPTSKWHRAVCISPSGRTVELNEHPREGGTMNVFDFLQKKTVNKGEE